MDISPKLDAASIKKYQSLIGAAQWVVSLGRLDIATAVMTLSSFQAAPREGHLSRIRRVFDYLAKMKHATIRFRTGIPDYLAVPIVEHEWQKTDAQELVPDDAPRPLGKPVLTTTLVDANLCHDMAMGRAVTGIVHFINQTVIDFYSKKQSLVKTATYGSEFMAARTGTEQIIELHTTLRYLGVPIQGTS